MTDTIKCQKEHPDFCSEVDKLSVEQLKARIVGLQQALEESEAAKEADEGLIEARNTAKELGAPYRDVKKAVKLKTKYILDLLKERA